MKAKVFTRLFFGAALLSSLFGVEIEAIVWPGWKRMAVPAVGGGACLAFRKAEADYAAREEAILRLLKTKKSAPVKMQLRRELEKAFRRKNFARTFKWATGSFATFMLIEPQLDEFLGTRVADHFVAKFVSVAFFVFAIQALTLKLFSGGSMSGGSESLADDEVANSPWKVCRPGELEFKLSEVIMPEFVRKNLNNVAHFVKNPAKLERVKAKVPRGVLFTGPPGCGKTLAAKSFAASLGFNYIGVTGSDFVNMFVGTGANAIRSLFKTARENAPCVVFIDEIDAVARTRKASSMSGELEYERTLNQLLFELDGSQVNKDWDGVFVFGATNLPESVDDALTRPGRLGKVLEMGLPGFRARREMLKLSLKKSDVVFSEKDLDDLARESVQMSGAQICEVVNQAAINFVKSESKDEKVSIDFVFDAIEVMQLGEISSDAYNDISLEDMKKTAYHESGHALASILIKGNNRLGRITILPRVGGALGVTFNPPEKENGQMSKEWMEADISRMLGGMAAERVVFGKNDAGVSDDLLKANRIAAAMITQTGMSSLGPSVLLPGDMKNASNETKQMIEKMVKELLEKKLSELEAIFKEPKNREMLETLAKALMFRKTLTGDQVRQILGLEKKSVLEKKDSIFELFKSPLAGLKKPLGMAG